MAKRKDPKKVKAGRKGGKATASMRRKKAKAGRKGGLATARKMRRKRK